MKRNKSFASVILFVTAFSLYSCNVGAPAVATSTAARDAVPAITPAPTLNPVEPALETGTPVQMVPTTVTVAPIPITPTECKATPISASPPTVIGTIPEQRLPAFAGNQVTQPPIPMVIDLPARSIDGNWNVRGQQIIENEKLVINGQVRVLSNASLTLKNAVLEINYPSDSFDPWPLSGTTSLYVERGGSIEIGDSFIIAARPRAMLVAQEPRQITIRNSTFRNVQWAFIKAQQTVIEGNTFVLPPDQGIPAAVEFYYSSGVRVLSNNIIGESSPEMFFNPASNGIHLFFSDHNEVRDNTIFGTRNGVSLLTSSNNQITGNVWSGPKSRQGEAGIGMERWSNSNVVENNTLENAGSAILFILESKNNKISANTLRNAGLGIVLRWTSGNIIDGNTLEYVLEDGIRAHRSYGNSIFNNQISYAGEGVGLFTSWENQIGGNVIEAVDRGFYLFDARQNQIRGNEVRGSIQSVLAVESAGNVFEDNNFIQSVLPAMEDSTSCVSDTWRGNYWESAPRAVEDSLPAGKAWPALSVPVPEFRSIEFGAVRNDVVQISDQTVWDGQAKTITGGITIERGGRLVIRNSTLTFAPEGMQREIWISVLPGGALEIDGSVIHGPEKDHDLRIKVHADAEIIMRNSELHNAGSWVGPFGAAIGYQGKSALIENNIFENVYCAFSSEPPAANIQFINNTITNSLEAVAIIMDAPDTTIAFNQIRQSAIWGIQIWSLSPRIGSVVRENRVEDSWGMGVFDAFAGSFTIEPNNTSANLKGPGLVILEDSFLDARQFRPISLTATDVQAGDNVTVMFDLMPFYSVPHTDEYVYTLKLSVNDVEIAHKEIDIKYGEAVLVTLEGKATSAGAVKLSVQAKPR